MIKKHLLKLYNPIFSMQNFQNQFNVFLRLKSWIFIVKSVINTSESLFDKIHLIKILQTLTNQFLIHDLYLFYSFIKTMI